MDFMEPGVVYDLSSHLPISHFDLPFSNLYFTQEKSIKILYYFCLFIFCLFHQTIFQNYGKRPDPQHTTDEAVRSANGK